MTAVWLLLLLLLLSSQSVDGLPYPDEETVSPSPVTEKPDKTLDCDSKLDTLFKQKTTHRLSKAKLREMRYHLKSEME